MNYYPAYGNKKAIQVFTFVKNTKSYIFFKKSSNILEDKFHEQIIVKMNYGEYMLDDIFM